MKLLLGLGANVDYCLWMVTREVPKQSWTALLEQDQLQIRLSVDKQRNIIGIFLLSSQLFFEQWRPNIV